MSADEFRDFDDERVCGGYANDPRGNRPLGPAASRRRPGRRAKILDEEQLQRVLDYIEKKSCCPESDRLKVELSFRAGLRACEIVGLRIGDVTDADGRIADHIHVRGGISKGGRERFIPMHPEIGNALRAFRLRYPEQTFFAISHRTRTPKAQSINALTVWFFWFYKRVGLYGCSSHTGRRTFLTNLARMANEFGGSLRDVQILAGHARLDTTAAYIEPARNLVNLVQSLGSPREGASGANRRAGERH